MPVFAAAIGLLVVAVTAWGIQTYLERESGSPSGLTATPESYLQLPGAASGIIDSDRDGAPDALENFLGGSDPARWNSSRTRLPDGWLIRHGYDPLDPTVERTPAAVPPPEALPSSYANTWPDSMRLTLWDVYSWGRPDDWNENTDGVHENPLDPREWDSNDDGIPDAWMIRHGMSPLDAEILDSRLAGPGGLTVKEAFFHGTDPRSLDTDEDGIEDAEEIRGPLDTSDGQGRRFAPTDPRKWSTAETGICDGYLVAHGLDPAVPSMAFDDQGPSGASTIATFQWSQARFGSQACATGAGLDPTAVSTLGLAIPDGWLMHYFFDPLDPDVVQMATQSTEDITEGRIQNLATHPDTNEQLPHVALTVLEEYLYQRPREWDETKDGPWWGGSDPTADDTDGDGIDDAVEIRGYWLQMATDVGPGAPARWVKSVSDATKSDSDGDTLPDHEEVFVYATDPDRKDTDMDDIPDAEEVSDELGLDPLRADTAGDYLRDGVRLTALKDIVSAYEQSEQYGYPGEPGVARSVLDWASDLPAMKGIAVPAIENVIELMLPGGDLDGDSVANVLDADMDDDGLLNGWEHDAVLYRFSPHGAGLLPRAATDMLNPDTDGDTLVDGWEVLHGMPIFCTDGCTSTYSLDPSKWDSDANGVSDAKEDPDEDSIFWPVYERDPTGLVQKVPDCCLFQFSNDQEQRFGADPNLFSTKSDGLGDGWKVFWGQVYPTLQQEDVGLFFPHRPDDPARFRMLDQQDVPRPSLNLDQSAGFSTDHQYTRFLLQIGDVLPNEQIVEVHEDLPDRRDSAPPGATIDVFEVRGIISFGFAQMQAAGTNPYLLDTSGDGIFDWWAYLYRQHIKNTPDDAGECQAGARLDPLTHYAIDFRFEWNPLPVRQEYRATADNTGGVDSTNPLCKDTDLDTVEDWFEIASSNLDPLDPSDAGLLHSEGDIDGDGVRDGEEIFGVRREYLGSKFIRTNATNPDTDGDGLLDGPTLHGPDGTGLMPDDPWTRLYLDLGIAYYRQAGKYHFLGEADENIRASPSNPDDSGTGVPAGWLATYSLPVAEPGAHLDSYTSRRPSWWNEESHGPWWGGVGPGSALPSGDDLDGDGLRDHAPTGGGGFEDPMPSGNFYNIWRAIDWTAYPSGLGLADPGPSPSIDLADGRANALVTRIVAQAYLNERSIENHGYVFHPQDPDNVAFPCFDESDGPGRLRLLHENGDPTNVVRKGQAVLATGRLVDCTTGEPWHLHGVTLEARYTAAGLPYAFGAGFTDELGRFSFPVNLTKGHQVDLDEAGDQIGAELILRGRGSGVVSWSADPGKVPPGKGRFLEVRSYASPNTPPHVLDRPALAGNSAFLNTRVEAESLLTVKAPEKVRTGSAFRIDFRLTDTTGSPLQDSVVLDWPGGRVQVTPRQDGTGSATLAAPHSLSGPQPLIATSMPAEKVAEFVTPAHTESSIILLNPIRLDVVAPATADAGTRFLVRGNIAHLTHGGGIEGLTVRLNLSGKEPDLPGSVLVTDQSGGFSSWVEIPPSSPNGVYSLIITVDETQQTTRLIESRQVLVRSLPAFTEIASTPIRQGSVVSITGRLLEPDGQPLEAAAIGVQLHTASSTVQTGTDGRFAINITPELPARPVLQTISFAGDASRAPASQSGHRTVLVGTVLEIGPGRIARGEPAMLVAMLTLVDGTPVTGAPIMFGWATGQLGPALTDERGRASMLREGEGTDQLGPVAVRAEYDGSIAGGRDGAAGSATWIIDAAPEIVLPDGTFMAGAVIPDGVIRDAATLEPVPGAELVVQIDDAERTVVSGADGTFAVLEPVPRTHSPEKHAVLVKFAGSAAYDATANSSVVRIMTGTDLAVAIPKYLTTGQAQLVEVRVTGHDGKAVPTGSIIAASGQGIEFGRAEVQEGPTYLSMLAPATTPPGATKVTIEYSGAGGYANQSVDVDVIVRRGVHLALEPVEATPGQLAEIRIIALSDGEPLSYAPVYLVLGGAESGLTATTNAEGIATFHVQQELEQMVAYARYEGADQHAPAHATTRFLPIQPEMKPPESDQWLTYAVVAAALVLLILVPVIYKLRRDPLEPVFRHARRILGARGPVEEQILRSYRLLEEIVIGRGYVDNVPATPRTVQEAFMANVPMPVHASLDRLVTLFEVARYSTLPMTRHDLAEAKQALREIISGLREEAGVTWRILPRGHEAA